MLNCELCVVDDEEGWKVGRGGCWESCRCSALGLWLLCFACLAPAKHRTCLPIWAPTQSPPVAGTNN